MADYGTIRAVLKVAGDVTTVHSPDVEDYDETSAQMTVDEAASGTVTATDTVDLSSLGSVGTLVVKNTDSSDDVRLTLDGDANGATYNVVLKAGEIGIYTDVDFSTVVTFTLVGGHPRCKYAAFVTS